MIQRAYSSDIEQNLVINQVTGNEQVFTDVANTLLQSQTITAHDESRMHRETDQLQSVLHINHDRESPHLQQLGSKNDDTRGSITNLLVLQISKLDKHFGSRMLHFELLQNRSTIVCDRDISHLVHLAVIAHQPDVQAFYQVQRVPKNSSRCLQQPYKP